MKHILLLNGPNLNLLGTREPQIYGHTTLADIERHIAELVGRVHRAREEGAAAAIVNAGAYTHTSVALRDALAGTALPFVEVHISNVYKREAFRHHSYLSDIAIGVIAGLGVYGYEAALRFLVETEAV